MQTAPSRHCDLESRKQALEERRGSCCPGTAEGLLGEWRPGHSERCLSDDGRGGQDERASGGRYRRAKKLISAFTIGSEAGDDNPADELLKMNALIRSNLGINPNGLSTEEYAIAYNQAIWLESFRLKNNAELLAAMFGGKKKG